LISNCCNVGFDDYQTLLLGVPSKRLLEYELFKEYKNEFDKSTDIVNLKRRKSFKDLSSLEKEVELNKRFLEYLQIIEKDKLYYFILAFNNPQKVLIVKSPADNKEQKQFLGYEWSNAKGNEGLKYLAGTHITPLFDPDNRYNDEKINYWIQQNFNGNSEDVELQNLSEYITYASLVDLLDFSRKDFNKTFSLTPKKNLKIETKWELVKLGEESELITKGTTPTSLGFQFVNQGINFVKIEAISLTGQIDKTKFAYISQECDDKLSRSRLAVNDILFSIAGALGRTTIVSEDILPANTNQALSIIRLKPNSKFLIEYVYLVLSSDFIQSQIDGLKVGIAQPNLSLAQINEFKIPLPPLEVQQQIVDECETIDEAVIKAQNAIEQARNEINSKVKSWFENDFEMKRIQNVFTLEYGKGLSEDKRILGEYPVMGSNGISGYHNEYLVKAPTIIVGRKGSAGKVVYVEKNCFPIDTTFYVKLILPCAFKYLYYVLLNLELEKMIKGIGVPGINRNDIYQLQIPLPPLSIQEKLVSEVEKLEQVITNNQKIIDESSTLKQQVMKKYL
jgi:restriction endonuclease S subunit